MASLNFREFLSEHGVSVVDESDSDDELHDSDMLQIDENKKEMKCLSTTDHQRSSWRRGLTRLRHLFRKSNSSDIQSTGQKEEQLSGNKPAVGTVSMPPIGTYSISIAIALQLNKI